MEHHNIVFDLFIMFTAARLFGEVFVRLKQPAVIGELLAGAVIGVHALGWIQPSTVYSDLAEIGVVILMFSVGLHTKVADLVEVGKPAVLVGFFGIAVPFGVGYAGMHMMGFPNIESLFVATALLATSVGISARVLADMGLLQARTARIVLGAAILDDILALMVLAVVTSIAQQSVNYVELIILALEAVFFIAFLVFVGAKMAGKHFPVIDRFKNADAPFAASIILCLGLSELAEYIGLAAIIGAFMAGIVLADIANQYRLEEKVNSLAVFLVPFFFVMMGMEIDLRVFLHWDMVRIIIVVVILAVVGKVIGSAIGTWNLGVKTMLRTGACMIPRGEVGIVVGSIGLGMGTIEKDMYTVVVAMSILTTVIAPPLITWLFRDYQPEAAPSLWGDGE